MFEFICILLGSQKDGYFDIKSRFSLEKRIQEIERLLEDEQLRSEACNRIFCHAYKRFDVQVLFYLCEEDLNLPAAFVKPYRGWWK